MRQQNFRRSARQVVWVLCGMGVLTIATAHAQLGQAKYCDSLKKASSARHVRIRAEALLVVPSNKEVLDGGEKFFFSPQCNNRDFFSFADISRVEPRLLQLFGDWIQRREDTTYVVEFEGVLTSSRAPTFGHLNAFRSKLEIQSLKRATRLPVGRYSPDFNAPAPQIEEAQSLYSFNYELMSAFLSSGEAGSGLGFQDFGTVKIFLNGRAVGRSALYRLLSPIRQGVLINRILRTRQLGYKWKLYGRIESSPMGDKRFQFNYQSVYGKDGLGDWKLEKLHIHSTRTGN